MVIVGCGGCVGVVIFFLWEDELVAAIVSFLAGISGNRVTLDQ